MTNKPLNGKKLLILAGGPNLVTLVQRAKELGVYTIVTDYYDHVTSPAKDVADEAWDISWSDLDTLEQKCREAKVDGITTGYSESPVECCINLCERLGLPCYCTQHQLDFTRDKVLFKKICRENGVPTVKEYATIDDVDEYPVILKPADRAGSIGVGVAKNRDELIKAYDYAMEKSYCKEVIIEKYITGTKIDLYYEIRNGKITFISSDDVIMAKSNGTDKVVQSCWVLPSRVQSEIIKNADEAISRLLTNLEIKNGYIFISGFDNHGEFIFFETGFRLCGGHLYNYFPETGHVNNMDIFIFHALTGSTSNVPCPTVLNEKLKCVNINIYAKSGTIRSIEGMDKIAQMDDCRFALTTAKIGQECHDDKAILDKVGMFYFCNEDPKKLQDDVEEAYKLIKVTDTDGNDMIYDRIDTSLISTWWN